MSAINPAIRPAISAAIRGGFELSGGSWSPTSLFAASEVGVWYDPSDLSTMFQDSAGTTPVTADGQPVGKILDKSGRGNHATQATAAKRPVYKTSGGLHWLQFDGVDDALATGAIDFSATDEMSVFSGVTRSVDTSSRTVYELSAAADNAATYPGSFMLRGPQGGVANFQFVFTGSISKTQTPTTTSAPFTAVLHQGFKIASDSFGYRLNGAGATTSSDLGAGNIGNYPLYIGGRAGTSLYLSGNIYSLIVRNKVSTTKEITSAESYVAGKSGVVLP